MKDDWGLQTNESVMATEEERKQIEKEEEEVDEEIPSEDSHCQNWQHNLDQRLASSKVCIVGFNDASRSMMHKKKPRTRYVFLDEICAPLH